ncbi:MAG: hypothetical protein MJY59_05190 [Bacteroidaceae bacterium]|nr:hypothetical protein [Bacteroidaceae bacterium]
MKIRRHIATLCLLQIGILCTFAQKNVLTVPDVIKPREKQVMLGIGLENTADITAVEFVLTLPEGFVLHTDGATLTERTSSHSFRATSSGQNKYKVMIFSSENSSIIGRTGKIIEFPVSSPQPFDEGSEHQMSVSDVVLAGPDGSDLTTGYEAGKIKIVKSPDLEVSAVTASSGTLTPGGQLTVGWNVTNIGGLATEGGWNEQIFLVSSRGNRKLVGTVYHEDTLEAGGSESRSATLTIPAILGLDGEAVVSVKVNPNSDCGEPEGLRTNNECASPDGINVTKTLTLTPEVTDTEEKEEKTLRLQLTRSGDNESDETFEVGGCTDSRVELPQTVTIASGKASTYLYVKIKANGIYDAKSGPTQFSLTGANYNKVSATLNIEDDTYPDLRLTSSQQDVTEGGTITMTVSTDYAPSENTEIKLSSDFSKRFDIPSALLHAGENSVDIVVEAVDDNVPDIDQAVTFTAFAAGYNPASMMAVLIDNDIPNLSMTLMPDAVSEAAGPLAVTAKVKRLDNIDKKITVKLSDDSNGGIYYGRQTFDMEAGVSEATLNLGPIDNSIVDGERTHQITAAVYIASCSCNAGSGTSAGSVTVPLTVYDNDGPTLTLISGASVLKEGSGMTIRVRRNTSAAAPLTVSLSCDHGDDLEYPATVTIPSGADEASFTVMSKMNDIAGDGFTATMTASADGFAKGNIWFSVSDQTLPDAQIESLSSASESCVYDDEMVFNVTLVNRGNAPLPENTMIQLFKSDSRNALAEIYTTSAIPAGETSDLSISIKADFAIGRHSFYVKVNAQKDHTELNYSNNSSSFATIDVVSPFSTSTSVSKTILGKNDEVEISGKASGRNTVYADIDVYIINKGYRHVITTKTDDEGCFSVTYKPFENQDGHFIVGSCFHGERTEAEQCAFDKYAIEVSNSTRTCDVNRGESHTSRFVVKNNGVLPISNVRARLLSELPNARVTFSEEPFDIAGGGSKTLEYTITGVEVSPELAWQTVKMEFTCDEGATATSAINFYIREPKARLKADVTSINTSVTVGSERDYHITLTNTGKSATGPITFALPAWMRLDGIQSVSSLNTGESVEVVLLIGTSDDMQINNPKRGSLGVNCENGDGISIPYSIEPVSTRSGILSIDVCDQNTYYTTEAPHVAGAKVVVRHPATGAEIITGVTDASGIFATELQEGYYELTVSAEKHESVTNNVYVDPERTRNLTINLGYQGVTFDYIVTPTEIEDQYTLVTKVNYETNVPVPCVVLDVPEKIDGDNMKAGESTLVYITATNKGLVTALNNTIILPENTDEWMFEPLTSTGPVDLPSQQSVLIPVRITRLKDGSEQRVKARSVVEDMHSTFNNCMVHIRDTYDAICGDELKNNESCERMAMKMCALAATSTAIMQYMAAVLGGGEGKGGDIGFPSGGKTIKFKEKSESTKISGHQFTLCNPCDAKKAEELLNIFIDKTPLKNINKGMDEAYEIAKNGCKEEDQKKAITKIVFDTVKSIIEELCNTIYVTTEDEEEEDYDSSTLEEAIDIIEITSRDCSEQDGGQMDRSWQKEYDKTAKDEARYLDNYRKAIGQIFGDDIWLASDIEKKMEFARSVVENKDLTDEEVLAARPASVSNEQALNLFRRLNGLDEQNAIDYEAMERLLAENKAMDEAAVAEGYESLADKFIHMYEVCTAKYQELSSSVCASITLKFSQDMTMKRKAFRGTLTVFNGNEENAMTDVRLSLVVRDEDGNVATTHEFGIRPESLTGFEGELSLDGSWTLDAQQTGVATILFTPTKHAAPTADKLYSFGGSLSYVDPFTGLAVTRNLAPVTLTVSPSPVLDLTYFMQRDIKGDDPLTEVVEPSEEAEFSLLINNVGYGDATNVRMATNKPEIVDNEKGLNVDFELVSSQLNGGEKTLALGGTVATDFGTIPAKTTSYAQWWLKSSLLGHFTTYDIEATHVTSYGNPDLSLLGNVTIHELIRSLEVDDVDGKLVGFMTNDFADAEDMPDMVYLSDGETENVYVTKNATTQKTSDTDYTLTVTTTQPGWVYGSVTDPTHGIASLKSVRRQSDGKEIPLRNFWQTDRTLRDGKDPLYENRLHFADYVTATDVETYVLTFEPTPELLLDIVSIEDAPEEGALAKEPVDNVKVMFNKRIDPTTFTSDDISLAVQGVKQDISEIGISTDDNKSFTIDFSSLNESVGNGYFVLTVNTSDIMDAEGYPGKNGKQANWIMYRDGLVGLSTSTYPVSAGTVRILPVQSDVKALDGTPDADDRAEYGSIVRLATTPNDGYVFSNWTVNGEVLSTNPDVFEHPALGDLDIKANYVPKTYPVTISGSGDGGVITGSATGIYTYGYVIDITACANEDYVFEGWTVNGQNAGNAASLSLVVDGPKDISANYRREVLQQSLTLARGWNWISSHMNEPVLMEDFLGGVTHVVGQFDELIDDPVYGMTGGIDALMPGSAYKVDVPFGVRKSFKGHLHNLSDSPIELHTGWNWISYPYMEERDINEVLNNASEGDYMTSQLGFSEFADGYWEGTLSVLVPGHGYIYKSATEKTLVFDFSERGPKARVSSQGSQGDDPCDCDIDVHRYSSTMSIIARISAEAYHIDGNDCLIYAFAGNECRGVSQCVNGKHYLTVYGDDETDIMFVIVNTGNGDTYVAKEKVRFSQEVIGSRKSPFIITIAGATDIRSTSNSSRKMQIHSVEGMLLNPEATRDDLKTLRRGIYIVDGQKFMVK